MSRLYTILRLGPGPTASQRQASAIYLGGALLCGLGALVDAAEAPTLWVMVGLCGGLAALAWWLPWRRWHPQTTLVLALPAFGLLAWAGLTFDPVEVGAGSFFVLIFVWAGLHHPPAAVLALVPAAAAAYLWPLVAAGQSAAELALRILLVLPVMVLVALVIADRVDRLEQAKARLARAEQWRSSLMLTLAHDVRAPLTAVQSSLELLTGDGDRLTAADRERLTAVALRQAGRIRRLATELIELERIEAGQVRLRREDVPLRRAIAQSVEHAGVTGVAVRVEPPGLAARADPVRLEQILVNLVGNAQRHGTPPIVVAAEPAGDQVRISVRDHGAGMPAGGQRVFQRFSSADRSPDSVGLGLWVARQMVLAHGGRIRYEPADPGARFVFTLPAAPGPAPAGPGGSRQWAGAGPGAVRSPRRADPR